VLPTSNLTNVLEPKPGTGAVIINWPPETTAVAPLGLLVMEPAWYAIVVLPVGIFIVNVAVGAGPVPLLAGQSGPCRLVNSRVTVSREQAERTAGEVNFDCPDGDICAKETVEKATSAATIRLKRRNLPIYKKIIAKIRLILTIKHKLFANFRLGVDKQ
jgi:hypothetical protein